MNHAPRLAALAAFVLLSCAQAADLTGVLTEYLLNKVSPTQENTRSPGVQARMWDRPARLNADRLLMVFAYGISTDHWTLIIIDPHSPAQDYLGSRTLTLLGKLTKPTVMFVYRIESGRFQGYPVEDAVDQGHHLVEIYTPKMASMTPELSQYVK